MRDDCDRLVEMLRIPEVPTEPGGMVMVPITEVEFPVNVMTVVPETEELVSKRQDDEREEPRGQITLLFPLPPITKGVWKLLREEFP